jgi:acylphosphatase
MHEINCVITGKVQGVAYRAYVQDAATELEVFGWVRNLPDGTVEVVAQGPQDLLKDFVEYLHEGSLMAKVDSVAIDWRTARQLLDDFSIKH